MYGMYSITVSTASRSKDMSYDYDCHITTHPIGRPQVVALCGVVSDNYTLTGTYRGIHIDFLNKSHSLQEISCIACVLLYWVDRI